MLSTQSHVAMGNAEGEEWKDRTECLGKALDYLLMMEMDNEGGRHDLTDEEDEDLKALMARLNRRGGVAN